MSVDKNVLMRIIKRAKLLEFCEQHPQVKGPLTAWYGTVRRAHWKSLTHLRQTYPRADEVRVASGKMVVVFNIKGNDYRLIAAVHYAKVFRDGQGEEKAFEGKVFLFFLLSHAEYTKEKWKGRL
jgi:mRNA interferase HigB